MASLKFLTLFSSLFTTFLAFLTFSANGQSATFGTGSLVDKGDHSTGRFLTEEGASLLLARSASQNCAGMANSVNDNQHDAKQMVKLPYMEPTNTRGYYDYRYYLPVGALRSKKAQKAILLDVGDYVTKGNESPIVDSGIGSGRSPNMMGGILRSSGK